MSKFYRWHLTQKQLKMHACIFSTVATDALVLKLQTINIHSVDYRQFSNIRRTQSQNINVSRLVLQLSLPNPLKPGVKLRMKM